MLRNLTMTSQIKFSLSACLFFLLISNVRAQRPELIVQTGHSSSVEAIAFSPDGRLIASIGGDAALKLWEVSTGRELRTLKGHSAGLTSVAFSPDSKIVASASNDTKIKFWDVISGEELRTLSGHSDFVMSIAFSPDGKIFASAGAD